ELVVVLEAGQLARAEVEGENGLEVAPAQARIEPQSRRLALGDVAGTGQATPPGLEERRLNATEVGPGPHGPEGVDEGQAGPVVPLLAEIEGELEARQAGAHGPVADEQHGVGVNVLGTAVQGERHQLRGDAVALAQQDLREGGAGARAD